MGLSNACRARIAAGALFLLILLLLPTSAAQLPIPLEEQGIRLAVICTDGFLEPDYLQQDSVTCIIQDFSRDAAGAPGSRPAGALHPVSVFTRPSAGFEDVGGWQILVSEPNFAMRGGESRTIEVRAVATPGIDRDEYDFELVVAYSSQTGYNNTTILPMVAQVNPYGFALTSWTSSSSQQAGQDEVVTYTLALTNDGVYPDSYQIGVTTDDEFRVAAPPDIYIPAKETRNITINVLTPRGKLYEIGKNAPVLVKITSMGVGDVPGSGIYSASATLQVRGAYVPIYWIPLTLIGLVSTGVVIRAGAERGARRSNERGTPRPVAVTPRQAVLLDELKRSDREKYKEKQQALDVVYKERVADFRGHRKERLAADREEARQASVEFVAQKKARKAQAVDDKRARIAAKRAAKIEARDLKKREKVVAKARKKLVKAQKKQAKIDARAAKKQAKIDAKQAAVDAKTAAAAARAQAKADKAAAKAAKKAEKEQPK